MSYLPKVTVLMSVHNSEKYLKETINSVLNQTFKEFEFIIVNDCSTDKSLEIIKSYQDYRIVLIDNIENLGLTKSLNLGIKKSQGEYIARIDADDICFPDRLETQVKFLDKNKSISLCGGNAEIIDAEGNTNGEITVEYTPEFVHSTLFFRNIIIHPSVMFRKKDIVEVGMYNEEYKYAQDYELWLRLISNGKKLSNVNHKVIKYRIHDSGISIAKKKTQSEYSAKGLQSVIYYIFDINTSIDILINLKNIVLEDKTPGFVSAIELIFFVKNLKRAFLKKYDNKESISRLNDYVEFVKDAFKKKNIILYYIMKFLDYN